MRRVAENAARFFAVYRAKICTFERKLFSIAMKKTSLTILSLFFILSTQAQDFSNSFFSVKDTIIGKTITGNNLVAKHFKAPESIYRWHWDGYSDNLLLELRKANRRGTQFKNDGYLQMIDLTSKSPKWRRSINFTNTETKQQGQYLLSSKKKKNYLLNPETGNVIWENNTELYFIHPLLNIGLGYPLQSTSNKLSAIDMRTGSKLWTESVDRFHGWNDAYLLTDSVLLIANTNGITALNLTQGKDWHYKVSTGKVKVGKMIAVNLLGILTEVLVGGGIYQTMPDEVRELNSNMLIDSQNNVIYASRDKISKISSSGEILWSTALPKKTTSKSSIVQIDSLIYMINRGHAVYNEGFSTIGAPYISAFNGNNGAQHYLHTVGSDKDFVRTFQVVNNLLFLVFENKLATYSLQDGSLQTEKIINLHKEEQLDAFVESGVYIKQNDSVFFDLTKAHPTQNIVVTSDKRALVITDELETLFSYEKTDVFEKTIDTRDFKLLTNNDEDFILCNALNNAMATFKAKPNMFIANNKLYAFDKDSFWELDLEQFN